MSMTPEETYRSALRAAEDDLEVARALCRPDQEAAVTAYAQASAAAADAYRAAGGAVPATPLQPIAEVPQEAVPA
jgi:hypothetical protein